MIVHVFREENEIPNIAYDSPYFWRRENNFHKFHMIVHVFGEGKGIQKIAYEIHVFGEGIEIREIAYDIVHVFRDTSFGNYIRYSVFLEKTTKFQTLHMIVNVFGEVKEIS